MSVWGAAIVAACINVIRLDGMKPEGLLASGFAVAAWTAVHLARTTSTDPLGTQAIERGGARAIVRRLYLSAFWGLLGVGAATAVGYIVVNLHDYWVVGEDWACWTSSSPGTVPDACNMRFMEGWEEWRFQRAWGGGGYGRQDERLSLAAIGPLWLIPVITLTGLRAWVVWLLGVRPAPVPPQA